MDGVVVNMLAHPITRPHCSGICSVMLAGEEDCGRKAVWPHHKRLPKWFIPSDWACWPVLSYDKRELHIVAVYSAKKGALRRLIDGAAKVGLSPVIVGPLGQMTAILKKWGWQETIVGEGWDARDEWRPIASPLSPAAVRSAPSVNSLSGPANSAPDLSGDHAQGIAK